jgi:hypothetical protein
VPAVADGDDDGATAGEGESCHRFRIAEAESGDRSPVDAEVIQANCRSLHYAGRYSCPAPVEMTTL